MGDNAHVRGKRNLRPALRDEAAACGLWFVAVPGLSVLTAHILIADDVLSLVPGLWESTPDVRLCVHCGVGLPGGLFLEKQARNGEYVRLDNNKTHPASKTCVEGAPPVLSTTLDLSAVRSFVVNIYLSVAFPTQPMSAGNFFNEGGISRFEA
jgi:hypothetical protein